VLELRPEERAEFLRERTTYAEVRQEVERLLAEYIQTQSGFLSVPMFPSTGTPPTEGHRPCPGDLLAGRFRIVRFIASGGMGDVYEADELELQERVAIKTVRPEILRQPDAMVRFKREIHLARQVTHPNVCRVFDLFRNSSPIGEETVFISMELLHGKTEKLLRSA